MVESDIQNVTEMIKLKWNISSAPECVTDLDKQSEMISLESILLKQASFLEAVGAVVYISTSLKLNNHKKFSLPKSVKRSVWYSLLKPFFVLDT